MADVKENFFKKIFSFLFPTPDDQAIKNRQLKKIAKEIAKSKYSRWYHSKNQELSAEFAAFLFRVYKVLGPARALLSAAASSQVLKTLVVEQKLTKQQKTLLERLSEAAILEQAQTADTKTLTAAVEKNYALFTQKFNAETIKTIDQTYASLESFVQLALFDYYFVLRKFEPALPEGAYSYIPKFRPIKCAHILDELNDFSAVLHDLSEQTNWKHVFEIITAYKTIRPVNDNQWTKIFKALIELRNANILEKIIAHSTDDPLYTITYKSSTPTIARTYLQTLKATVEKTVRSVYQNKKNNEISRLAEYVFGKKQLQGGLYWYTIRANDQFEKRRLSGFLYTRALNYLKVFLTEYASQDVHELSELFLVRGNWGSTIATSEYSESFYALAALTETVTQFDESLSETSNRGMSFRKLLSRMDRERTAAQQVNALLNEVNKEASALLNDAMRHIIVMGKHIKLVLEDYKKPRRIVLQNWNEIEQHARLPIEEWGTEVYKKIYAFVSLIKLLLQNNTH